MADLAELGARRVSVGSALARVAWSAFAAAARELAGAGSFKRFAGILSTDELSRFFAPRA